jgi:amino acid transporter
MATIEERRRPLPQGTGYVLKRAVLGPPLPTSRLEHERLGKPTALAVFASDNLSSSAYATEEILKVLVPVIGAAAFALVLPITFGILAVLAILLFSYRQTIRAYPTAGGAYIVTKDNFGILPAQLAGVALLTDYVLTVSVSVAAGIAAVPSAAPSAYPYRVWLSVFCIWFIAWGNLRGVRESGRMFAIPTYFFIVMMFVLLGVGVVRAFGGELHPLPIPADTIRASAAGTGALATAGIFLVLRAFASGGAAVTGVEAISNGVPAFKPPEWRNARTTLMWMGSLLGVMFLGMSFLAVKLRVYPSETKTVNSLVGRAVFGQGGLGTTLFLMLQIATTLILILAANTSFADFPRLANFHATDNFMPRQLTKRGHRLVFSNGIVGLAIGATLLVVLFQADVHRLIPLYAFGVFTSFTLSQGGMAKRHIKLKEEGWRSGLVINGVGAVTTGIVTVIIAYAKFGEGAWAVMLFVPIMVVLLVRMNHRYQREDRELNEGLAPFDTSKVGRATVVVPIEDLDRKTIHALRYAKTVRSESVHAVHFASDPKADAELGRRWKELGTPIPLEIVTHRGDLPSALAWYISALSPEVEVNVVVPGPARLGRLERLRRGGTGSRIAKALIPYPNARTTLVRDHLGDGHPPTDDVSDGHGRHVIPRLNHRVVVLVGRADRASLQAVRYALSLGATEVRAVHAAVDQHNQDELIRRWMELRLPVQLDVIECWDRNVARSLEAYVVELMDPHTEVTVVLARRDYAQLRQRILHDRTSRSIAKALGRYEHVDIAVVPYHLEKPGRKKAAPPTAASTVGYPSQP